MYNKISFLCLIILCLMQPGAKAQNHIKIVTEEWPPFNYLEDGELTGFSLEIVQSILKTIKADSQIEMLPSLRSTFTLNTEPHTAMFSLFRTPEREDHYKWVGPLCDGSIYFYKRSDNRIKLESLEDIKKVERIACRQKGLIPDLLKEQGFKNLDMTATGSLQIYKKLIAGRCALAISDSDLGMRYYLKQLKQDPDLLEKIPVTFFESELFIAFSKDTPDEEIQKWQSALDELIANGTYGKIFDKYSQ